MSDTPFPYQPPLMSAIRARNLSRIYKGLSIQLRREGFGDEATQADRDALMTVQIQHYQQQIKWEPWKAMAVAFGAGAAFMGAIVALLGVILHLTGHL